VLPWRPLHHPATERAPGRHRNAADPAFGLVRAGWLDASRSDRLQDLLISSIFTEILPTSSIAFAVQPAIDRSWVAIHSDYIAPIY